MVEKLTHFPVNWVDGMKINKNHFIAMQYYIADMVRDAIGATMTPINYGIIPFNSANEAVKISLVIDNHKLLRVKIDECHAVTLNGSRIEISSDNTYALDMQSPYPEAVYDMSANEEVELLVNIIVNSNEMVPFGELDPTENPPRLPFLISSYQLQLVPKSQSFNNDAAHNGYRLTVGKIIVSKEGTHLHENYIPPCTIVGSHKRLIDSHLVIDKFLGQIELYSVQIAQKVHRKQQTNDLATTVLRITDKVIDFLGNSINSHRSLGLHSEPYYMYDKVISLARVVQNFIDSRSGSGKEELLNYFAEWCGVSQSQFEVIFNETINVNYDHLDIEVTDRKVKDFMQMFENLLSALNRLDFIGKRKDTGIFVKETNEGNKTTNRKSFFE